MNRANRHRARDPQPDAAWLTAALREQAHKHEPDSGRISARFEHLIAGDRRPGEPRRAQPRKAQPRRSAGPARLRLIGVPLGLLVLASATVAVAASLGLGNTPAAHPSSTVAASQGGPGSAAVTSGPGALSASSAALPTATTPTATAPPATTQPVATPVRSASGPAR